MRLLLGFLIASLTLIGGYQLRRTVAPLRPIFRRFWRSLPWGLLIAIVATVITDLRSGTYRGRETLAGLGAETTLFCVGIVWEKMRRRARLKRKADLVPRSANRRALE